MIAQIILAWVILSAVACGRTGVSVEEGTPCQTAEGADGVTVVCGDTSSFIPYPAAGQQGPAGKDGVDGTNGKDGRDGIDGIDGIDGLDAFLEVITLCPSRPGLAEVLLRLPDGQLLAYYSHDNRQFLVMVPPGDYVTTDGRNCSFTVDADYTVTDQDGNASKKDNKWFF